MSDSCSGFLHTLWLNHTEIDFSFLGDEVVEEEKQYTAEVAKDAEASTPLDPSKVIPPTTDAKVLPTEILY